MTTLAPYRALAGLAALLLCLTLASCAAVRARRAAPEPSGFLGDYSQLKPSPEHEARLIQIDEKVEWSRYKAIHLDSVTLWAEGENVKLSPEDQQMLTDVLYAQLARALGGQFELADRPAADVMLIRAALTQAKGANVPLRAITSIVPPAFLLSTVAGLSTDTAATVGTATVEIEGRDALSGRRLFAAADSRAGTKSILAGARTFQKWGDVEAACRFWADRVTAFLVGQGVVRKKGAADL